MTGIRAFNDYQISSWKDGVMIRVVEYAKDMVGSVGKFVQENLVAVTVAGAMVASAVVSGVAGSMPPVTIPSGLAATHAHATPMRSATVVQPAQDAFQSRLSDMERQLMMELAGLDDFSIDSIDPSSLSMAQEAVRQTEFRNNEDSEQWADRFFAVRS